VLVEDYAKFRKEHEDRKERMDLQRVGPAPPSTERTMPEFKAHTISVGGKRTFYGQKWAGGLSDPSSSGRLMDHRALRSQARSAYHDSVQARGLVDRFADTIVDIGLKLDPTPLSHLLGITPEFAEEWARDVGERHHLWAMSKGSYRSETMNWYQAQRLAEIFQQRDNDYFVRLFYNKRRDLLNPLQVLFIDPDQIVGDALTATTGLQTLMNNDGIVRDTGGREIGYKVQRLLKDGQYKLETIPAFGPRSKRRFMLHGFQPDYAGQGRGYSRLAHALQEFQNLTDFTLAQIKKAINQANLTMFIQPSKDNVASNPWDQIMRRAAGPVARTMGADADARGHAPKAGLRGDVQSARGRKSPPV
jgi:capsid protein